MKRRKNDYFAMIEFLPDYSSLLFSAELGGGLKVCAAANARKDSLSRGFISRLSSPNSDDLKIIHRITAKFHAWQKKETGQMMIDLEKDGKSKGAGNDY